MSSDEGVLVCQSCNKSAARLCIVVASLSRMEAVRAVPPQKGPVLLFFFIIVVMGRVGPFAEVDACGSVESALSRGISRVNSTPSSRCRHGDVASMACRANEQRRRVRTIITRFADVPQQRHAP